MLPNQTLPAVLRFIPTLQTILARWPDVTPFKPTTIAPTTFSARLRDAITGIKKYHLDKVELDQKKFLEICDDITVSLRDDLVLVGSKEAVKLYNPANEVLGTEIFNLQTKELDIPRLEGDDWEVTINALAHLLSKRIGPLANGVRFHNLTQEQIDFLSTRESCYDINVLMKQDGSYVML